MQNYEKRVRVYVFENGREFSVEKRPMVAAVGETDGVNWIEIELSFISTYQGAMWRNYHMRVKIINNEGHIHLSPQDMQENAHIRELIERPSEYDEFVKRVTLSSDLQNLSDEKYLREWLEDEEECEPYRIIFDQMRREIARSLQNETKLLI
jgi:hypothetical protein